MKYFNKISLTALMVISVILFAVIIYDRNAIVDDTRVSSTASKNNISNEFEQNRIKKLEDQISDLILQQKLLNANQQANRANTIQSTDELSKNTSDLLDENNSNIIDMGQNISELSPQDIEEIKQQELAVFTETETSFYNEELNESWSSLQEDKIKTLLENEELKSTNIVDIECRSVTCRTSFSHESNDGANEFLGKFVGSLSEAEGEFSLQEQADGSIKTVVILKLTDSL